MDIRILPSNIANMIAAGEVVQRPASVVKELMENAVDAGADQVTVVITDAGRTLIQVIDNGCGMSPDEAVLCFERHATSKIASAEDLEDIRTFGFRGEALASIAAVAEVTLKTRREEDPVGCQVEFADSKHLATVETAAPKGSNFSVRNLFYNVPARRKFLKSDNVEFKHIVEEFTRVALTRPEIGFTLIHNGRDIHVLKPAKSLKFRIQDLLGNNAVDKVVDVAAETSVVAVSGYVCRPDAARKTVGSQFFFVNGRYFRSPYLHKAVMKAYEDKAPLLVIGGCAGSFLGEYQAGGTIIVLDLAERASDRPRRIVGNFPCTGMHGGRMFLRADCRGIVFPDQVTARVIDDFEREELRMLLAEFCEVFAYDVDEVLSVPFTVVAPDSANLYRQMYVTN